jgi:hypothetical protein
MTGGDVERVRHCVSMYVNVKPEKTKQTMRPQGTCLNYVIEITFLGKTMEPNMASLGR